MIDSYNRGAFDSYNDNALEKCPYCNRSFLPERMKGHYKICTKDKPFNYLDDKRVGASNYVNPWGDENSVHKEHVYDASFVKLREVSLSYRFSKKLVKKLKVSSLSLAAVGKNLWIIHKNIPFADPEAGLSSGNIQGNQSGAYPSVREYGLNFNVQF